MPRRAKISGKMGKMRKRTFLLSKDQQQILRKDFSKRKTTLPFLKKACFRSDPTQDNRSRPQLAFLPETSRIIPVTIE
ncbi:hypothetical protein B188_24450 [Candidatus Brocadiaceae bacterium B188]|jgi:hypothetical protein|nr:MAG: hypothetical protein B6D34_12745 [Candidatus Brocadia sp. UTAMX1]TWU50016.1 hypothetical protein B188_24450 [Candidatus Brocadiaceae bacterium B188]